jgi:AcrR family transcriptional regulator
METKTTTSTPAQALSARERLLQVGASVFAKQGFGGASVREICKQAGTSANMIHHYFGSKQGLYDEILSQFSERVFTVPIRIIAEPATSRENLITRFEIFLEETLLSLIANQDHHRLVVRELAVFPVFITYNQQLVHFLEDAKDAGFVRAELDSAMLTGMILDRLGNQILYASWIRETSGYCVITDAAYRKRWLKANLDMFLNGTLTSQ